MNLRIKPVDACVREAGSNRLRRSLGAGQLMMLGIGAIIGSGIFVLIGVGAQRAGPGLVVSFIIAGAVCAFVALAYAELATMVPVAGSAYTYSYAVMGELVAWLVGWNLILEYAVSAAAVAVGWSGYIVGLLRSAGLEVPVALSAGWFAMPGGVLNAVAVILVVAVTALLVVGTQASARVNAVLVMVKLAALLVFIAVVTPHVEWANFQPFMPFGFGATEADGTTRGVMAAAALLFFAYVGFDAVSTAAEETRDPNRNVPRGLLGSLLICTLIYVLVAVGTIGTTPYYQLAASSEPVAFILRQLGYPNLGNLIALAAIVALPTVVLTMIFGQSRIFFVMSRDGLLPEVVSRVHPRLRTPHVITLITGGAVAVVAGLFSVDEIAELSNTGTLFAFIAVSLAVMVLRRTQPERARPFRCPAIWLVGSAGIAGCLFLFWSLPRLAQGRFVIWTIAGVVIYFLYGYRRSHLGRMPAADS